jgi:flagellar biogenesis protein FliO
VISEGAVPVDDPTFPEGDLRQAVLGLLIVLALVGSLLLLVVVMDKRGSRPQAPALVSNNCPYCGRFDHGGQFCPYCGGRLR